MTSENYSFSKDATQRAAKRNGCLQLALWMRDLFVNGKRYLQNFTVLHRFPPNFAVRTAKSCLEELFFNNRRGLIADIVGKEVTQFKNQRCNRNQ